MSHLPHILPALASAHRQGETVLLVTVVATSGSTYRRPGARMVIRPTGATIGMVSGGCLERDILERGQTVLATGAAVVVTYDSTSRDDILWGLGLGCQGTVTVLIEVLSPDGDTSTGGALPHRHPLQTLAANQGDQPPMVLASVFAVADATVPLGAYLSITAEPSSQIVVSADRTEADLVRAIALDAETVLHRQQSTIRHYSVGAGIVSVFLEFVPPPVGLVIFGSGQDVLPLVQGAKSLGWRVTVVDCRAQPASPVRFAMADQVILTRGERLKELSFSQQTAAVVMTHNYLDDRDILNLLHSVPLQYIGLLGSRQRTHQLLMELQQMGLFLETMPQQKLHAPIGLDIGAETPEQIALAILAEIQAVLSGQNGGFLKNSSGSIHTPTSTHANHLSQ
ncbi:MAG: XdhC family protein [Leptolyngbyaceae bacterium]|nr:XdhC family protein [Leptolyngbyaceae bacterium]